MKILKKIIYFLFFLVAIILVTALLVSKDYLVEKEITIKKPSSEVYGYIKYLKNQNEFSKWASLDPNMKQTFSGTDNSVGFTSHWEGNSKVGIGEQEIKKLTEGKKIDYELRFEKPMKDVADAYLTTDSITSNETKVKWGISGHMKYPMNIMGLIMDKMIGGDLEVGLANLKAKMEK